MSAMMVRGGESAKAVDVRCAHCSLPVPRGLIEPDAEHQFCCAGCRGVFETIHGCGLERYYALRDALQAAPAGPAPARGRYEPYDDEAFHRRHVQRSADGLCDIDLRLSNVHCAACVWLVERLPRVTPGVVEARLSMRQGVARVTWDPARVTLSRVAASLDALGYPPHPAGESTARDVRLADERRMLVRMAIAGACAGNVMLLAIALYGGLLDGMSAEHTAFLRWVSLVIALPALLGPGMVFFRGAWAGLRARRATLDLPIALALFVGVVAGLSNVVTGRGEVYFDSLCMLVFLLLVGRYVQMRQHRAAAESVDLMRALTPVGCRVWRGNAWAELPVEALRVGDRVRVLPGERVPADGVIADGASQLDRSLLTGESLPRDVRVGDEVFAGSINVGRAIELEVRHVGAETRVHRLMSAASAAVREKPAIVAFADRIAGWFTLGVITAASAVFAGWWYAVGLEPALDHTVALLIVACPCALGLATPLTLALAVGVAARRDVLVKDAAVFERLAKRGRTQHVLALDKTGTLTHGRLRVSRWHGDETLQPVVGRAEADARHPAGVALHAAYGDSVAGGTASATPAHGGVVTRHDEAPLLIGSARLLAAHGLLIDDAWRQRVRDDLHAGATVVWVAHRGAVRAAVALADTLREDSADTLAALRRHGWSPRILSGDGDAAVHHTARALDISADDAHAGLSPEDKRETLAAWRRGGAAVTMVGDGVNDAAALAAADVGVAVQGGAEAALAVADVYTARPGVGPVLELVRLSRFTLRVVHQNLGVSLFYNGSAVALAAAGLLSPWVAAILMPVSSASVLGLAVARLSRWKGGAPCR